MSFCLGRPLPLVPSINYYNCPNIISLCRELPLSMCPIQFFCLVLIISIKDFSSTFFNTFSFVLCSVQLILSILLHIHISKASIRLMCPFLIVLVSAPYSVTLRISALTILFLMSLFNPPFLNTQTYIFIPIFTSHVCTPYVPCVVFKEQLFNRR